MIAKLFNDLSDPEEVSDLGSSVTTDVDVSSIEKKLGLNIDQVDEMIEVSESLKIHKEKETIGRAEAIELEKKIPGLISSHLAIEEFTKAPSNHNYVFVSKRLELSLESLIEESKGGFITEQDIENLCSDYAITKKYLERELENISLYIKQEYEEIVESSKLLITVKFKELNLLNVPLTMIDYDLIEQTEDDNDNEKITRIIKNTTVVKELIKLKSVEKMMLEIYGDKELTAFSGISYGFLFNKIKEGLFFNQIKTLFDSLETHLDIAKTVPELLKSLDNNRDYHYLKNEVAPKLEETKETFVKYSQIKDVTSFVTELTNVFRNFRKLTD